MIHKRQAIAESLHEIKTIAGRLAEITFDLEELGIEAAEPAMCANVLRSFAHRDIEEVNPENNGGAP